MDTPASWKIGMALAWVLMLIWLPWGPNPEPAWWGPAPSLGQTAGTTGHNPERLKAGSFSGTSFLGSTNIAGNNLTEINSSLSVEINNSFQGFSGIAQINQSAGSLNNQANVMAIAGGNGRENLINSNQSHTSRVEQNVINTSGNNYHANISGSSFTGGAGVVMVNQAAGNMNTQLNVFNLTFGEKKPAGAIGLTDHELGAIKANNSTSQDTAEPNKYSTKLDLEGGSFKNFTGLVNTSQVAGNKNQVSTVFNMNIKTVP